MKTWKTSTPELRRIGKACYTPSSGICFGRIWGMRRKRGIGKECVPWI
ncbi:MAG: hypothetical protein Q4C47_01120 [Planctomycetia bacterium]|nr:hypothetical protein [Planctomycetia bacterium]